MVGPTSEYKVYLKLKKDIDEGRKAESVWFKEKREVYKDIFIQPSAPLANAWATFWSIRLTKFDDNTIIHQDILAYQSLMRIDLLPQEVNLITTFDSCYYHNIAKYKK